MRQGTSALPASTAVDIRRATCHWPTSFTAIFADAPAYAAHFIYVISRSAFR